MRQKFKAVVIDDDEMCREFLANVLQDRGYAVDTYAFAHAFPFCRNKAEQCQAEQACADLLLTDNRMPLLTGLDMIQKLRSRGCKLMAGSLAILSGNWEQEDWRKAQVLGCQTFEKPYDLKKIADWLSSCEECC
jgi:CheY-like chemotaxis protein